MSTPKIKVYRLDKGYNQDADNDIQTKVNSEVLPFIEKKSKPTDAYYLTAVSDQKIQWNGEKINLTPKIIDAPVNGTTSGKFDCTNWIKKGYFRPKVGYIKIENDKEVFCELASSKKNEEELLKYIEKVKNGETLEKPYFTQESFIYAHPFVFTDLEDACYEITVNENELSFVINEEKIADIFGPLPVTPAELKIKYYVKDDSSTSLYLENYPVYYHSNYFYNPQIFVPEKISLSIVTAEDDLLYRNSQEIECDDAWIYYGNGSPIVTCDNYVLEKEDYELIYSFNDSTRKLMVKISEEYLNNHKSGNYSLFYNTYKTDNTDSTLISEYEIDSNTGKITFGTVPENFFVYYYQKVQRATTFVSENVNWSFGHLRENPDVFFGEKDYPGDEKEDTETGTPLYSGMKPSFIKDGFQIDYMRGAISFTDGYKSIYKSEAENLQYRDTTFPETFVRANYSYYPEVFGVFRQKLEMVSDVDGYTYKPVNDLRYPNSIKKRWIMKNDNYQPMFFENWTDKVNVCSQYLTTAPNYDKLSKKTVIEISDSDLENNTDKLTFILPLIESKFIVFKTIKDEINTTINVNDETFNLKITKQEDGSFYVGVNEKKLQQGEVANINTNKIEIEIVYLCSSQSNETKKRTFSFQIISIKNIE